MSAGTAVLIGSSEHLTDLKQRTQTDGEVFAFADTDALRALDLITRKRPGVVALEGDFALTSRGTALIKRIKADPSLTACEIRILAHEGSTARSVAARAVEPLAAPAVAVAEPAVAAPAALDQRGTRRAPRVKISTHVEVSIDGNAALLVDLSVVGAQVISATILRPNQRIRIALPDTPRPIRLSAAVAWASFEMQKGIPTPQYRAGLEFCDADPETVQRFIDQKKQ